MKVLVCGGTGFLGRAIVRKLREAGNNVFILSRKAKGPDAIPGDITKPETLPRALEGMEAVVQCVQFPGHPFEKPKKGYTYWQTDALGTENLSKLLKPADIKQLLYVSGAGTDGKRNEPWFRAKWYAEQAARASGIQATILRPSWIYGPEDNSLNRILAQARWLPFLPMIGNGKNRVQPLFINDLAEIVSLCLNNPYQVGLPCRDLVFQIGGPEEMTMREMMARALKVTGLRRPILPIPKWLVHPMLGKAVDFITMDVHIDTTALKKAFPTLRLKTIEEGLNTYAKLRG